MGRSAAWCLVGALTAGCGGVVDGRYVGEPLFSFEGRVYTDFHVDDEVPDIGLLWLGADRGLTSQALQIDANFPAQYRMDLFHPPHESQLREIGEARFAIGQPVLYFDWSGDGQPGHPDDEIVGGSYNRGVLYLEGTVTPDEANQTDGFWLDSWMVPGYQQVRVWRDPCNEQPDGETGIFEANDEVALFYGPGWMKFIDWECGAATWLGRNHEGEPICPPGPVIEQECNWYLSHPEAGVPVGVLQDCLEGVCPELFDREP